MSDDAPRSGTALVVKGPGFDFRWREDQIELVRFALDYFRNELKVTSQAGPGAMDAFAKRMALGRLEEIINELDDATKRAA